MQVLTHACLLAAGALRCTSLRGKVDCDVIVWSLRISYICAERELLAPYRDIGMRVGLVVNVSFLLIGQAALAVPFANASTRRNPTS